MNRRLSIVFATSMLAALAAVGLPSCAEDARAPTDPNVLQSQAPTAPVMPVRPIELRLEGLDPCALLTAGQRDRLGLRDAGSRANDGDRFGSADCLWGSSSHPPYGGPLVRLVVAQGVQYYVDPSKSPTIVDVSGFPAVQTQGAYVDPDRHCLVLVDVAPGQTLWTQYSNDGSPPNGITNRIACAKAREAAGAILVTLRAQLKK